MHASFHIPSNPLALPAFPRGNRRFSFALGAALIAISTTAATAQPAIRTLKGANQQTAYGSSFAVPLAVWVTEQVTEQVTGKAAQLSLAGVEVHFSAGPGIALSSSSAITDRHGLAAVTAIGTAAGDSSASAQISGLPSTSVRFEGLRVNKAVLTVVPADLASTVGSKVPPIASYTIRGFVNGDTEASAQITGAPVLTTTAKDTSPLANYAIKGGVGTLSAPNYSFVAGFGTLAISAAPNAPIQPTPAQEATLDIGTEVAPVRPALGDGPISLHEPAFLAGLHGQSGVFVQTAIWQRTAKTSSSPLAAPVKDANFAKLDAAPSIATAPVRPAGLNQTVAPASKGSSPPVRTAVANPASAAPKTSSVSVRSAALNGAPAMTAGETPSYANAAIRKAFNPPGAK